MDKFYVQLNLCEEVVKFSFTVELALRIMAQGLHPYMYFNSFWNIYDFGVVVGAYLTVSGTSTIVVLRLIRVLRMLKLAKEFEAFEVIITGAMKGLTAAIYILIIIGIVIFVYAVLAHIYLSENDPATWGLLHIGMLTLFQIATLDSWTNYAYTIIFGCEKQPAPLMFDPSAQCTAPFPNLYGGLFFMGTFTFLSAYVLVALFIGAINIAMQEEQTLLNEDLILLKRVKRIQKERKLSAEAADRYLKVFQLLDITASNRIGKEELIFGLQLAKEDNLSDEAIDMLYDSIDLDGNGELDFAEFMVFMLDLREMFLNYTKPSELRISSFDSSKTKTVHDCVPDHLPDVNIQKEDKAMEEVSFVDDNNCELPEVSILNTGNVNLELFINNANKLKETGQVADNLAEPTKRLSTRINTTSKRRSSIGDSGNIELYKLNDIASDKFSRPDVVKEVSWNLFDSLEATAADSTVQYNVWGDKIKSNKRNSNSKSIKRDISRYSSDKTSPVPIDDIRNVGDNKQRSSKYPFTDKDRPVGLKDHSLNTFTSDSVSNISSLSNDTPTPHVSRDNSTRSWDQHEKMLIDKEKSISLFNTIGGIGNNALSKSQNPPKQISPQAVASVRSDGK